MTDDERASGSGDFASPPLSDAAVRAIAERLVQEQRTRPSANPSDELTAPRHELSAADEERVDAALAALLGLPPEITSGADHREGRITQRPPVTWDGIAEHHLQFLDTELAVANTMLDAAEVTRIPASRTRRVARAWEAHDEVARHLADDQFPVLTAARRDGLTESLAGLRARLDAAR